MAEPFINYRKLFQTPGFVPEELRQQVMQGGESYEDETVPLPRRQYEDETRPLPPRQEAIGLSGMIERAPDTRPRRELPPAPLPPKVSTMRNVLGTAAGLYLPQIGEEIKRPGYQDQRRQYGDQVRQMQAQAEIDNRMAQAGAHDASAEASRMRAAEYDARRRRAEGQIEHDKGYTLSSGQARFGGDNKQLAVNPLPPKPVTPGLNITVEEAKRRNLAIPEGATSVEIPSGSSSAYFNTSPRSDRGYDTLKQSIRDANPDLDDAAVDAKASAEWTKKQALTDKVKESQANRNNRPYAGRSTGLTAAGQNAEDRRKVESRSTEFIAEKGGLDQAIADLESWSERDEMGNKVLTHLKGMKGKTLAKGKKSTSLREAMGGSPKPTVSTALASSGPVTVSLPNGKKATFKDQASADAFKKAAGI